MVDQKSQFCYNITVVTTTTKRIQNVVDVNSEFNYNLNMLTNGC